MKDLLGRTIRALNVGADVSDIHAMLIGDGLTEYQAWLTFKAARLCVRSARSSWCRLCSHRHRIPIRKPKNI